MMKKKRKKWWIGLIIVVVILGGVFTGFYVLQQNALKAAEIASVKTVTAQTGSITKTVNASGNLEAEDTFSKKAIIGLKINDVLVEKGDVVKTGQKLASLDTAKLEQMVSDTDNALQQLDMELKALSGKETEDYVYAPVKGRVKNIYAKEGDNVSDTLLGNGSLMLLSTDGYMKVTFEPKGEIPEDLNVTVRVGDEDYDGTVTSVSKDTCVALITDDGPALGDTATVTTEDGSVELGQGKLEINSPLEISGTGGTVDKIYVDENDKISRNKKLIRISENPLSSDYAEKLGERQQKMEEYVKLLALEKDPYIVADKDGIIEDVKISDGAYVSADVAAATDDYEAEAFAMNSSTLKLNVDVDELDMPYVKVGQEAQVSFDALQDKEYPASVESISMLGNEQDGSTKYTATLKFDQIDGLYEGMSASATITVEQKNDIVMIPAEALQEDEDTNYVYLDSGVPGQLGEKKNVKTGLSDGEYVEITEGLQAGDKIMYKTKVADVLSGFAAMRESNSNAISGSGPASSESK